MIFKNFQCYSPKDKPFGEGVQYFKDETGQDFYGIGPLLQKDFAVFLDPFCMVRAAVKKEEVTSVYPVGLSLFQVKELPEDFDISKGPWLFKNGAVQKTDYDLAVSTAQRKRSILSKIGRSLSDLSLLVEEGSATKEEIAKHKMLKATRSKVLRIEEDKPSSEIEWSLFKTN